MGGMTGSAAKPSCPRNLTRRLQRNIDNFSRVNQARAEIGSVVTELTNQAVARILQQV